MIRRITLASCAVTTLALATITGCSSNSTGSGSVVAALNSTSAGNGSSNTATGPTTAAGTSSSAAQNTSGSGIDVCTLLTATQATSLNNVTYSSATPSSPASYLKACTYKNAGSSDPINIQDLNVSVYTVAGCWTGLQQADGPGKPVSGVGDSAFGTEIGLDVEVGSKCLTIMGLTHAEFQNNYAPDVAMAKIILAKLS